MIPLVVSTYPENGSKDVELDSPIKITFADLIDNASITTNNVKLENENDGRDIPITFSFNTRELIIIPSDDRYGNMLLGLTDYKLSLIDISSPNGEVMQGLHTMEFMTVSDTPENITTDPILDNDFIISNFYPKQNSYGITPTVIKVKCSRNIDEAYDDSIVFKVTSDIIENISDIGFVEVEYITGTYEVIDNVISFTPEDDLSDNTKYTVFISGILSEDGTEIEPILYSFYTKIIPLYATLSDIQTTYGSIASIIKDADPMSIIAIIKANSETALWIATKIGNESNITWEPPEKIVIEYVKAKTRYDLVFDRYVQIGNEASTKILGDLEVTYSRNLSDLLLLAEKLKKTYEYWENMLRGSVSGNTKSLPFRKGEDIDEDPEYKNRRLKDWTGTKSW